MNTNFKGEQKLEKRASQKFEALNYITLRAFQ